MASDKPRVTTYVTDAEYDIIRTVAARWGWTVSQLVRRAIKHELAALERNGAQPDDNPSLIV